MAKYAVVKASELHAGDEVKFSNGRTATVDEAFTDDNGVFVEFSNGDGGYIHAKQEFKVTS
ncbi:MAG TPA: hypothetical protein VHX38_02790 [Pseudonocardiaceae bacterium]|jgi:hypothetical protein|nr:hypothetical protein [Pseudonocardiaceae bacterium]